MTSATSDGARLVGPVLRLGEVADAVLDAIREDNPDREVIVERHASYVRILCPEECIVRYETVARMLGRAFAVSDIEPSSPPPWTVITAVSDSTGWPLLSSSAISASLKRSYISSSTAMKSSSLLPK